MTLREQLHRDGYLLLRQAIPADWLDALRDAFDAGSRPSHEWPLPRRADWLHSLLDTDPTIQAVCRLPAVLAAVGALIGERFFLSQVEGRDPLPGGGYQRLHRDMWVERPGDSIAVMAYFDDYGPENGATRLIPGSHRIEAIDLDDEAPAIQLSGHAGDVLVFDVDLVHGASLNPSGARRRSILAGYSAERTYAALQQTEHLRNVRMDTRERFEPADFTLP